jgi:hypothetical protein
VHKSLSGVKMAKWEVESPDRAICYFCGQEGFYNSHARLRELDQQIEVIPPTIRLVNATEIPESKLEQRFFVCTNEASLQGPLSYLARNNPELLTECERLALVHAVLSV